MQTIAAIPTKYNGVTFRSRLEARWAVFFNTLDIEWQYEREGYQLQDGTWYVPDFWLPGVGYTGHKKGIWLEIKPRSSNMPDPPIHSLDQHPMYIPETKAGWRKAEMLAEGQEYDVLIAYGDPLESHTHNDCHEHRRSYVYDAGTGQYAALGRCRDCGKHGVLNLENMDQWQCECDWNLGVPMSEGQFKEWYDSKGWRDSIENLKAWEVRQSDIVRHWSHGLITAMAVYARKYQFDQC